MRHLKVKRQMWLTACPAESEHLERKSTTSKKKVYENNYVDNCKRITYDDGNSMERLVCL
ncbi:hypothetical protein QUF49_00950 [Fictibacillus sp. b24]|uniref:hypothetical protein n=1 Tax=Fictibacillus sp. b24 TaxID=3055863 RepID=UPI0025A23BEA|nr:hypothetical protein [Fictibacillus sp. b24]MDM5314536.1 hypothetical protein [Fictibacillus sp. b24]